MVIVNPYTVLLKILDQLRAEAPPTFKTYYPPETDVELVNAARSRAFIHLLLKVYFGLLEFEQREQFVTEGTNDGGIDAYYIDPDRKTIYFIQSKFRTTQKNFEEKAIDPEELLRMDIDRILKGETADERGVQYNGRILTMARRIQGIENISRYQYRVILLANARGITRQKLDVLTGGFSTEVLDHQTCYSRLLFPLVSGTYYAADELHLSLALSNKSAGAKISYSVQTEHANVEITVVFVPTLEIANAMYKYRNSILRYNPRSYLEHEGQSVNAAIRNSIEKRSSNEFALFNNGITMLSDETYLNERIGQKDRAQLTVVNPQIINGGQTAYTLSQIFKENINGDPESVFGSKEVLLKILTFDAAHAISEEQKLSLIEDISRATNSQTVVTSADRRSNEKDLQALQHKSFELLGLFVERKRGEFSDGIREGYLDRDAVVDRNTFLRAAMIAKKQLLNAHMKKIAARCDYNAVLTVPESTFRDYKVALILLWRILRGTGPFQPRVAFQRIAQTYAALVLSRKRALNGDLDRPEIEAIADEVLFKWRTFRRFCERRYNEPRFVRDLRSPGQFDLERFFNSECIEEAVVDFFGTDQVPDVASQRGGVTHKLSNLEDRLARANVSLARKQSHLEKLRTAYRARYADAATRHLSNNYEDWIDEAERDIEKLKVNIVRLERSIQNVSEHTARADPVD